MKKSKIILSAIISGSMILSGTFGNFTASAASNVKVVINNKAVEFQVEPEIIEGRILVPLNDIATQLGGGVQRDENEKKLTVSLGNRYAILQDGSNVITYGLLRADSEGRLVYSSVETMELSAVPMMVNGTALVPIETISEALGATVAWDPNTMTVSILSSNYVEKPVATAIPQGTSLPVSTPAPSIKPVFKNTTDFQEVSGLRLQEMHDLNKNFAFIYYDSKKSNSEEAVQTIKDFAKEVGAKVYGFDVSTSQFTSNSKLKFINEHEWDKEFPTLFLSYNSGDVEIEQDFTDKKLMLEKLDNLLNNNYPTPLPTATPVPTATPKPESSASIASKYDFRMIDIYDATRMRDRGEAFMYVVYNSEEDIDTYESYLENIYEAAKDIKLRIYATDLNSKDNSKNKIESWMSNATGGYMSNPTLFYVSKNGDTTTDSKPTNISWIRMKMEMFEKDGTSNYWY